MSPVSLCMDVTHCFMHDCAPCCVARDGPLVGWERMRQGHSLNYYYPYVMQLFGASRIGCPNKFLVYSNPNVTTYVNYKGSRQGEEYRSYDAQYDFSFNSAWRYLKNEVPVDGFTLDVIFSETRTVSANEGSALIVVPALPSSPVDRAKLIITVLQDFQYKVNRRIEVAKLPKFTRCPECLPSTSGWNLGLINSVLRCLQNVEPHLEWGKFLVQSGVGQDTRTSEQEDHDQGARRRDEFNVTFEKANQLIGNLRDNTEAELTNAMNDVIERSKLSSSGICSWCGKKWECQEDRPSLAFGVEDSAASITAVDDTSVDSLKGYTERSSSSGYLPKVAYEARIVMLVTCIVIAGTLVFVKKLSVIQME
ncbi:hypothetical protein J3R30DRAFT_2587257 [Lentinula aciculospora]|uniref:Uncharacterized protein n=1 Tax=Lentinula aciculospora TaxID=153920 RepID=A0A9W9ADC1_9AGAR|nr:hypothetical protein J3R30DRAFT_2587257 [Lentinula aciculospora]